MQLETIYIYIYIYKAAAFKIHRTETEWQAQNLKHKSSKFHSYFSKNKWLHVSCVWEVEFLADLLTLYVTGTEDRHYLICRSPQIFQKSRRHFKIIGARKQHLYWGPINIRCKGTKFSHLGHPQPWWHEYTFSQNNLLSHYDKHRLIIYIL